MKKRAFALMITAILLGAIALGTASGIDNCCFVDRHCTTDREWNDGFHAFHHNQCPAPAQSGTSGGGTAQIDNCCYVDRQCHSDQDWINGYHAYQNGQCGAPAQSPAPVSSQPAGGAPALVDNCCFVNRQCHTDQDWISGYHAYQNGQCQAPAQLPAPVSSQPAGGAPAHIDNCCNVDRQCSTDLEWRIGWHAYRTNRCGAAGQAQTVASSQPGGGVILRTATGAVVGYRNGRSFTPTTQPPIRAALGQTVSVTYHNCCQHHWHCNSEQDWNTGYDALQTHRSCLIPGMVSIVGEPGFVDYFIQRLDELKNRLPHRYDYVLNGLNKIQQSIYDDLIAGYINDDTGELVLSWTAPAANGWEKRMSAVLVHEACHVHRQTQGYKEEACTRAGLIREEVFCREIELAVAIELGAPPDVIEWVRGMVARTHNGEGIGECL